MNAVIGMLAGAAVFFATVVSAQVELIIVPDGPLWYVPFEALQIQKDNEKTALIDKVRIRYAPMISLVVPDKAPRKRDARTAAGCGRLSSRLERRRHPAPR